MRFEGRVAIVTGGGAGIGKATSIRLADEGAKVLIPDICREAAETTAASITAKGGVAEGFYADISKEEDASRIASRALELWGRVDVLVNNAAAVVRKRADQATRADWETVFGVNVMGTSFVSKYVIPIMQKQQCGSIVNLGSINAFVAMPDFVTYNATKAAIVAMTQCMALDLAPYNIRVNCLCPGVTHTESLEAVLADMGYSYEAGEKEFAQRYMIKRFGRPDEMATAAAFLASDDASFMTAAALIVDGGYTAY